MTAEREGLVEEIAGVLGEHQWTFLTFQQRTVLTCTCGSELIPFASSAVATLDDYRAHLAAALADLLAARDRRVRGEALREAAEEWPFGWDIKSPGGVSEWIRDLADRIDPAQTAAATEENRP